MSSHPFISAIHTLSSEYKSFQDEPVEGFRVKLSNEKDLFVWEVAIFGPPDTLYQGGYFKARIIFPLNYPYSPPSFTFTTQICHPNVHENGDVCISILHPSTDFGLSGELACERWNPTQNVRTILLSVISLLNEPNTSAPANVEASAMYMRWKESQSNGNGKVDNAYPNIIRKQVKASNEEAKREGIIVPTTLEEYCLKSKAPPNDAMFQLDEADLFADDDDFDYDDFDYVDDDSDYDEDDQGSEEWFDDGNDSEVDEYQRKNT